MTALVLRPAATAIDWTIIKGETFDIVVPVLDDADQAVDVSTWTAKAQVRRTERDIVLHEWSTSAANISLVGSTVILAVVGAATSLWEWADALVSVEVYEPTSAKPHVIASGRIRALPEITQ